MKSNNRYQRMKRIAGRALVLGMLVYGGVFMTGCKEDECDNECKLASNFFMWMSLTGGRGLYDLVPCRYDYDLSPGDSVVINIPDLPSYEYSRFVGCSPASWTLRATPSVGITAEIWRVRKSPSYCRGVLLKESLNPGEAVSISGPAGCMSTGTGVIEIRGSDAAGTITVEFN